MQKKILITGVSTGIGFDAAETFLKMGWKVFGSVRKLTDCDSLKSEYPNDFIPLVFDVTDSEAIAQSRKIVESHCQDTGLHALINNAGCAVPGPMTSLKVEDLHYQLDVNVLGIMRISNTFYTLLKSNSNKPEAGKIINISSISGLFNSPMNGAYSISKHAVESMTEVYRREFYMYGIDVIAIQPGPIKTEIWSKSIGKLDKFIDSDYGEFLTRADKIIMESEKSALPVEKVTEVIIHCLETKRPKLQHIIHKNRLKFNIIRKYIPKRIMDKMIWKTLTNKKSDKYRPI